MTKRKRRRPAEVTSTLPESVASLPPVAHTKEPVSKPETIPTEAFFVHVGILLPLMNFFCYPARSGWFAWAVCFSYVVLSIPTYWFVKLLLRQNGKIESLWRIHVLNEEKSRVSVGVALSLLDHLHIIMVFGGILLCSVNALYWFEPGKTWSQSLYMALMAFNLKGFDDYSDPVFIVSRLICAGLSILSMLFVGFLATAFLKPFLIVFRHK